MTCSKTPAHEIILQSWRSAFGNSKVTYLSGPITTGPRFIKWHTATNGGEKENSPLESEAVIKPNSKEIIETAERLRKYWPTPIVEPASFHIREWKQEEYLALWSDFIETHSDTIIFLPSWQSSVGCITEFTRAVQHGKRTVTLAGEPLSIETAIEQARTNLNRTKALPNPPLRNIERLQEAISDLEKRGKSAISVVSEKLTKDESLNLLADQINVAQFAAFRPQSGTLHGTYSRVLNMEPNHSGRPPRAMIESLLSRSGEGKINVRSYVPGDSQSKEFVRDLRSVDEAMSHIQRLNDQGLWTIANESIDVHDGGVSGVLWGGTIEFSPDDTPRAVEEAGVCSLPTGMGMRILEAVYRFPPDLIFPRNGRLEFSLHPNPVGFNRTHTVGWEFSPDAAPPSRTVVEWPNRFSRHIGDKTFGLLVAHELGLNVPYSLVISRRLSPFGFGTRTGAIDVWTRTAPRIQNPGEFTTSHGWLDPFKLLSAEDENASSIAAIISQDSVKAQYSGASLTLADGSIKTEGVKGAGDDFMLGKVAPSELPPNVLEQIRRIHASCEPIGPVRFEWVYDGSRVWVVQLHAGYTASTTKEIVPGDVKEYRSFDPSQGLPAFKTFLSNIPNDVGVTLTARVGLTSHFADVLRRDRRPSKFLD